MSDEEQTIKHFNQNIDAMLAGESPFVNDPEQQELLEIAQLLHQTDLSAETHRLSDIRQQVLTHTNEKNDTKGAKQMLTLDRKQQSPLRILALSAAALAIFAATVMIVPPLRNIAQELFDDLFPRSLSDKITIEYNEFNDEDIVYGDSLAELETEIPFSVVTPEDLLETLQYSAIEYNTVRNSVLQIYQTNTRTVLIQQQPIEDAEASGLFSFTFDLEIGPETEVETVMIDDTYTGEIVTGMWTASATQEDPVYTWNDRFLWSTLRWQDDTYIYEVQVNPSADMSTSQLADVQEQLSNEAIAIATDMMD